MSDGHGELEIDGDTAVITFVRYLPYSRDAVWSALTDPEQRAHWFGETVIDARPGGAIDMLPTGPPVPDRQKWMTGRILVWDPPHVLEHEWKQAITEDGVVRYVLEAAGEGTLLTFSHRGLSVRRGRQFTPGTHAFLDRLECHLAGTELPGWSARYREVAADYPARP
ncbi:ATPase [Wenjunlia vitaminophila]|uniref:ATPase n=1 Tax=Wenjunlia vitaminophila TaxID=76728 RepID=A0A0T6LMU0_WENVI|nr:SRPBCC family protein [Wenjunlia vitaminophila]KRV47268.1 ATPase [Wenjunlia vitaminophila]